MEQNNVNENSQVDWNLSSALIQEIAERLSTAGNCYVSYKYSRCFVNLKALKMRVIHCFKDSEKKRFTKIEKLLSKYLLLGFSKMKPEQRKESIGMCQTKALHLLDKYNAELMDCLESYGYLISKKKDGKRLF